jgi:uncharacterized surface protein with fasciclin (FAS1) repeats
MCVISTQVSVPGVIEMRKLIVAMAVVAVCAGSSAMAGKKVRLLRRAATTCKSSATTCKATAAAAGHAMPTSLAAPDIVDTAVKAGSFKTLVAAVKAAGLVETLKGDGPFTVFAPTDEAFAKLPDGTVESLLKPENKDKLVAILTYHVVAGNVKAADVVKLKEAKTVQGQSVSIKVTDAGVKVDNAKVVKTDIECSNGVIHVIDSVILPPAKK